jgi:ADP-ribose pyrophosphatase YjhB (NUDIX family)
MKPVVLFGFSLSKTGITVAGGKKPSIENYQHLGEWLAQSEKSIQWWIGDWVRLGEELYSERASQAVSETGLELKTIQQYAYVADRVAPSRRDPALSFSHHREVADLKPVDQSKWLAKAKNGDTNGAWSVQTLRVKLNESKKADGDETTCWLLVSCKSLKDREQLKGLLESDGRSTRIP